MLVTAMPAGAGGSAVTASAAFFCFYDVPQGNDKPCGNDDNK